MTQHTSENTDCSLHPHFTCMWTKGGRIIKWPMPLGARPRSIKNVNEIYVPYTLDDIDKGSTFQNRMFISFPQFVYCSRDEVYFPKLSCLVAAHGSTLHSKWAPYNGCYASHSWRHEATCDVTAALWCHVVRGCLGDVSNKDFAIIENNKFINWIVISIEIQLTKTANRMAKIITLSVCK